MLREQVQLGNTRYAAFADSPTVPPGDTELARQIAELEREHAALQQQFAEVGGA